MKSNNYLKIVLTVIAINLTLLTIKELNLIPTANAAVSSVEGGKRNTTYGLVPVNSDGTINVKVTNTSPIEVNVKDIHQSYGDAIKVKIQ